MVSSGFRPPDLQIGFVVEIEIPAGTFSLEPLPDDEDLPINGDPVFVVDCSRVLPELIRERTHDDVLLGRCSEGLEVVGKEQIQQNVP